MHSAMMLWGLLDLDQDYAHQIFSSRDNPGWRRPIGWQRKLWLREISACHEELETGLTIGNEEWMRLYTRRHQVYWLMCVVCVCVLQREWDTIQNQKTLLQSRHCHWDWKLCASRLARVLRATLCTQPPYNQVSAARNLVTQFLRQKSATMI